MGWKSHLAMLIHVLLGEGCQGTRPWWSVFQRAPVIKGSSALRQVYAKPKTESELGGCVSKSALSLSFVLGVLSRVENRCPSLFGLLV